MAESADAGEYLGRDGCDLRRTLVLYELLDLYVKRQ